jgi:hypothetical protein
MFTHIASDHILQPLPPFVDSETMKRYPPIKAGAQILAELAAVNIRKTSNFNGESIIAVQ